MLLPTRTKRGKPGNHHTAKLSRQFSNTKLVFSFGSARRPSYRCYIVPSTHNFIQLYKQISNLGHKVTANNSFSVFAGALYQSAQCCRTVQTNRHFQCDASHESRNCGLHREHSAIFTAFVGLQWALSRATSRPADSLTRVSATVRPYCWVPLETQYEQCFRNEYLCFVVVSSATVATYCGLLGVIHRFAGICRLHIHWRRQRVRASC